MLQLTTMHQPHAPPQPPAAAAAAGQAAPQPAASAAAAAPAAAPAATGSSNQTETTNDAYVYPACEHCSPLTVHGWWNRIELQSPRANRRQCQVRRQSSSHTPNQQNRYCSGRRFHPIKTGIDGARGRRPGDGCQERRANSGSQETTPHGRSGSPFLLALANARLHYCALTCSGDKSRANLRARSSPLQAIDRGMDKRGSSASYFSTRLQTLDS